MENKAKEKVKGLWFSGVKEMTTLERDFARENYKLKEQIIILNKRIEKLRAALEFECGDRCDSHYNPCAAREALMGDKK